MQNGTMARDFELKGQINKSAGSVLDYNIEGFERFDTREFTPFLVISKGWNGEVGSWLMRVFDRHHINERHLNERLIKSELSSRKNSAPISYLQSSNYHSKPKSPTSNFQPPYED